MALRIAQITDPHLLEPGELLMGLDVESRFEAVLRAAENCEPDGYFFTGDFCANEPDRAVYRRLSRRFGRLGKPFFLIPGNHDDRGMIRDAFELGGPATKSIHTVARLGGRDFLLLDTSQGKLEAGVLDWLREMLPAYPDADLVMHHPPITMGVPFMDENYPLRERKRFVELLERDDRPRRIFTGHYHTARSVIHRKLTVYICPPTSFSIDPMAADFKLQPAAPGYQLLEWTTDGDFRCIPFLTGNFDTP